MLTLSVFLLPLLSGGLILIPVPGEAVIYYVTPTEPPISDCPGEPCQTLDYYFSHGDRYFSSDKINVTMILLHGKHTLNNGHKVRDLETFEMIGVEPAHEVVVYLSTVTEWQLINITTTCIRTLTLIEARPTASLNLLENDMDSSTKARLSSKVRNRTMFITIYGVLFNGIGLTNYLSTVVNIDLVLAKSTFINGSSLQFGAHIDRKRVYYIRRWKMMGCTLTNSKLFLIYAYIKITIDDSIFTDMLHTGINALDTTFIISGEVVVSNCHNILIPVSSDVTITGNVTFINNKETPIIAYSSSITLSGNVSFLNNTGTNGGAMALYSSTLNIASNTSVSFYNNSATEAGGAIYVTRDTNLDKVIFTFSPCFYQLLDYTNKDNWYVIKLQNNSAKNGGDHIYGECMHCDTCYAAEAGYNPESNGIGINIKTYLVQNYFTYEPRLVSPVSSDPTRVCLCDDSGQPQCAVLDKIDVNSIKVHPGETFTLPVVVVGADLGTTIGTVHVIFENPRSTVQLNPTSQYVQWINSNKVCSKLNYTIFSQNRHEVMYLSVQDDSVTTVNSEFKRCYSNISHCDHGIWTYHHEKYVLRTLLYAPPLLNVTLLPCPPGFTLLGDPPGCGCYPVLTKNAVDCQFINRKGYHSWTGPMWLSIEFDAINFTVYEICLAQHCPLDYCNTSEKTVNFQDNYDAQCLFNHVGRLCGGCKENYSLAIGSSHCIHCPNNNNLALLVFFAAAGFLLVLFINALNLTVTQGMINGLIFNANIVWTYRSILFTQQVESNLIVVIKTFIAWLNLDFGIQVCFVKGLNAFWKTWLQYLFPFYIWSIAGVIIIGARYSAKLTKLFGNGAVSVLATLFHLSYTKILQTIISSVGLTTLKVFSSDNNYTTLTVWSLDGHYTYCHFPHVLLFIAASLIFLFLWLPYTLLLFLMQWLRKISHLKLLKWIPRLNPVYDAYFAPLKDKHHYWFGVLLMVRGALLVIFTSTYTVNPDINHLLLLTIAALLLFYANYRRVYKNKAVQLTESILLFVLILVGGSGILQERAKHIMVYTSVSVGYLAFCGLIVLNALVQVCRRVNKHLESTPTNEVQVQREISDNIIFRDSVLDEIEPLLDATPNMD